MLTSEAGPNRYRLGFKEGVLSSFEFLVGFGLHLVDEQVTFVRYEPREVFVNVYPGRISYELGVEIGRLKEPKQTLPI